VKVYLVTLGSGKNSITLHIASTFEKATEWADDYDKGGRNHTCTFSQIEEWDVDEGFVKFMPLRTQNTVWGTG
jgi:hypothetical protein